MLTLWLGQEVTGAEPEVVALHAGLECGILGERLGGGIDMVSYGPTITGALGWHGAHRTCGLVYGTVHFIQAVSLTSLGCIFGAGSGRDVQPVRKQAYT